MMINDDPFEMFLGSETIHWILRMLERRWGLSLVSFLPMDTQHRLVRLQKEIAASIVGRPDDDLRRSRPYVEFHDPEQFHATHMVFASGQPDGPVRLRDTLRGDPVDLLSRIQKIAAGIGPIEVQPTGLVAYKAYVILQGECVDKSGNRQKLLADLNRSIVEDFGIEPRPFEKDPDRFGDIHFTIGVIKRCPPMGYERLQDQLANLPVEMDRLILEGMSLVHLKHNSLKLPHEGVADFPFGRCTGETAAKLLKDLNVE